MNLTPHEIGTPLWGKLQANAELRLSKCRTRLETNLDPQETIAVRAQIKELKSFLALAEPERKTQEE